MKSLFTILLLSLLSMRAFAQHTHRAASEDFYACGGDIATPPFDVQQYIKTHMRYPEAALKADIQGTVFISFIVDSTGMLQQFTIKRGADLGYGLPEEALRIVQSMPCWKPAKMNNKPVASSFTLPVRFILE